MTYYDPGEDKLTRLKIEGIVRKLSSDIVKEAMEEHVKEAQTYGVILTTMFSFLILSVLLFQFYLVNSIR